MVLCIRDEFWKYIIIIDVIFDIICWLKINGDVIEFNECLYICCIYILLDKFLFFK